MVDEVARRPQTHIAQGNLKPDDCPPTEAWPAARSGVARLSLRRATGSLELPDIDQAMPGHGLTGGRVYSDRGSESLRSHPASHDVSPGEHNDELCLVCVPRRRVVLDIASHRGQMADSGPSRLLAPGDIPAVFFLRSLEGVKEAQWVDLVAGHQKLIDAPRAARVREVEREPQASFETHRARRETVS